MFACLAGTACLAQTRADSLRARLLDRHDRSVLVAAHRGAWREAPENSLESIEKAIEMGVDIVEIDIRRTVGGELVLSHGRVFFRPEGSPTLEEALLCAKGRVLLNLDKAFGYFDEIIQIAERTGTTGQLIFKSSKNVEDALKVLGPWKDKVIYMPIINLNRGGAAAKVEAFVQRMDPPMYELNFARDDNPALTIVRARLEGRSRLWYNSLWPSLCGGHCDAVQMEDPARGIGWLIDDAGAGAVQTDIPADLIRYLKNR
jgi:glycerophosphoryl diester phosphodiesterase